MRSARSSSHDEPQRNDRIPENGDITGPEAQGGHRNGEEDKKRTDLSGLHAAGPAYGSHGNEHQVTLRTPAELADALPYLLGYRPEDSIVLVALHDRDGRGRFGGRARLGIPGTRTTGRPQPGN